jgi:hypothetical protein
MGSSYLDRDNLSNGTTYYYVVHAEDSSTGNGGACGGGNVEANSVMVSGTPYGPASNRRPALGPTAAATATRSHSSTSRQRNTGGKVWRFVKTADDPGANHTPGGATPTATRGPPPLHLCASPAPSCAPPFTAAGSTVNLQYWERHQLEYLSDAVAVEYSVNGGFGTTFRLRATARLSVAPRRTTRPAGRR